MLREIDQFYLHQNDPVRSCLIALRNYILTFNDQFTETWKYKMPCYCYKGKHFCYLWIDKKTREPYVLLVEGRQIDHPDLEAGDRSRMKILRIKPNEDLPVETLNTIFEQLVRLV
ncbi:DUF1801 domain-containing protein [Solitalea canadensis]|uniref:YdhG-like domain-containing protein n=1 Tax=Solitalea canadensis (strain ATCC 29591 / DSM 3403 / JCM 21819 / LMG 8368 / NBRC 15130 / NCIMB 12057 / USAM 9D) TaxID=929556 RepID=H8KT14_SOLCM|nr:DUF1801 domain-containing protein [Solitalea canadensis]AFD05585.1 protein of unknown function (DU1801) [Solitalea canadensis DSM 3403]